MEATMNVLHHHTPDELRTRYRTESNARMARRIQAVWLARKGLACRRVMDATGAAQRTVFGWIAKYNRGGIDELLDRPRSGRPAFLNAQQQEQLAERIEAGPREEDVVCVFNASAVGELVEKEFGVLYSLRGVQLLLGRLGFSYQCPRPVHENSDPEAQDAFKKTFPKGWKPSPPRTPASESKSTSKTKPGLASKAR
jgi:transposase